MDVTNEQQTSVKQARTWSCVHLEQNFVIDKQWNGGIFTYEKDKNPFVFYIIFVILLFQRKTMMIFCYFVIYTVKRNSLVEIETFRCVLLW